jgi:hypothetical protein
MIDGDVFSAFFLRDIRDLQQADVVRRLMGFALVICMLLSGFSARAGTVNKGRQVRLQAYCRFSLRDDRGRQSAR